MVAVEILIILSVIMISASLYAKSKDLEEQIEAHVKLSIYQDQKLSRALHRISSLEASEKRRCDFLEFEKHQEIQEASFDVGPSYPSGTMTEYIAGTSGELPYLTSSLNISSLKESGNQTTYTTTTTPRGVWFRHCS